jgi:arsenate reductase
MKIYGIKNCDTVKKSLQLLDEKGVGYEFVDFKKVSPSSEQIKNWIEAKGVDVVINKRGTTWRKLPDEIKEKMDEARAIEEAEKNPSLIKRPVVETDGKILIGLPELKEAI